MISINIVYFDLGQGDDYVYYGATEFRGIHHNDALKLSANQRKLYKIDSPADVFAEYYIIKVNKFNDVAKDGLDEWIYYFKNNQLPKSYSAPGLESVSKKLKYDDMSPQNKIDYDAYQKEMAISYSVIETAKYEGIQEGVQQGEFNKTKEVVINAFKNGIEIKMISNISGITEEAVIELLKGEGLL